MVISRRDTAAVQVAGDHRSLSGVSLNPLMPVIADNIALPVCLLGLTSLSRQLGSYCS